MSQSILLTSGTLPFRLSSPCRPRSRRSGTRVGVARQPPGDRDPSFSKPLPSFRLQPVNDKEEEEDHLTRTHHPMTACSFFAPSLSLLGKGALFRLGAAVEASGDLKKALIITESRGIRHIVEAVSRELFSARSCTPYTVGVDVAVYDEICPNPTTEQVRAALLMAEEVGADCLVSVGGGSTHDAAKAVRALFGNKQQSEVHQLEGVDELAENPILKFVFPTRAPARPCAVHFAVSTTSGSSAELTRLAVINDPLRHEKFSIVDERLTPTVTCDDTLLLLSQPPELVSASGMQALSHAMEAFLSTASCPVTDAAALHAIRLIHTYLRRAAQSPPPDEEEFLKAHEMLTYAEFLSGLAFNSAGLGLTHAICNQMSAIHPKVNVSECTSVILPHVLQYYGEQNLEENLEEEEAGKQKKTDVAELFVDLAAALGCSAPATSSAATAVPAVVCSVARLASDLKLPETLQELNARCAGAEMKPDAIPEVASKALTDPGGMTAPCHPTLGEVESLICRAWDSGLTGAFPPEVRSVDETARAAHNTEEKETPHPPVKELSWSVRYNRAGKGSQYVDFNDDAAAMIEEEKLIEYEEDFLE